jgi:hypothetical protein
MDQLIEIINHMISLSLQKFKYCLIDGHNPFFSVGFTLNLKWKCKGPMNVIEK